MRPIGLTKALSLCLAVSSAALAQQQPHDDAKSLAASVVAAREAESGFDWDERMRISLMQTLASLAPETLRQLASRGPGADLRPEVAGTVGDANRDLVFTPIPPCRVAISAVSVPAGGSTAVNYRIRGSIGFEAQGGPPGGCGIPTSAAAIAVNYTVASPSSPGHIVVDPTHLPESTTSVINFSPTPAGYNLANGVITPLCDLLASSCTVGDIRASVHFGSTLLITDITGYFAPPPLDGPLAPTLDWANVTGKPAGFADNVDNEGVTAVTASAPLSSSGGSTPAISLSGTIPVANGGTGNSSLTANGVLIGQGTSAVANAVGVAGQV